MNPDEELLTTNQQFVIRWLQTSLGGAWEGCQQNQSALLDKNIIVVWQSKIDKNVRKMEQHTKTVEWCSTKGWNISQIDTTNPNRN